MGKSNARTNQKFDINNLKPEEVLKFEIATELGLDQKIIEGGWRSLSAKESGRIGGLMGKRKKQLKTDELVIKGKEAEG